MGRSSVRTVAHSPSASPTGRQIRSSAEGPMLGGGFIETAISLALLYLMISLLCTIVVELGASFLGRRSQRLRQAMESLLYVKSVEAGQLKAKLNHLATIPAVNLTPQQRRSQVLLRHFSEGLFSHFADHPLIGKTPDNVGVGVKGKYISRGYLSILLNCQDIWAGCC